MFDIDSHHKTNLIVYKLNLSFLKLNNGTFSYHNELNILRLKHVKPKCILL